MNTRTRNEIELTIDRTQSALDVAREHVAQLPALTRRFDEASQRLAIAPVAEKDEARKAVIEARRVRGEALLAETDVRALERLLAGLREELSFAVGAERMETAADIKAEFTSSYARYREHCGELLAEYQRLKTLSDRYQAFHPRAVTSILLAHEEDQLNLPPLNSGWRSARKSSSR
jgi:hypothetical protein